VTLNIIVCAGLIVSGVYYTANGERAMTRCLGCILALYATVALIGVVYGK
jgi:hypothetical protein